MEMEIIHNLFSTFCHQDATRSPHYSGEIFPVCYRCAGLYLGILSSYLFLYIKKEATLFWLSKQTGSLLILCTIPLCIDGLANLSHTWFTPGSIRLLTGVLCGMVLPMFLMLIRNSSFDQRLLHKINLLYILAPLVFCLFFTFLLLNITSIFIFRALAVMAATGMILFFINMGIALFWLERPVYFENKH